MTDTLELVLILLAASVLVVGVFRAVSLPPVLGYLLVGASIGPHALGLIPDTEGGRHLAEFGVVFLMFSIGLEFSLPRIYTMKRQVFGLGLAQVLACIGLVLPLALLAGLRWQAGLVLGGAVAMSSTAVLSKLLTDRVELDSPHGREVMGVLLFQDIAVVPLLIVIPALARPAGELALTLGLGLAKAAVVLSVILFFGPRLMSAWFFMVAKRRSSELFMLNVLLITLGLAWLTAEAGLSLALGAFLAGVLISETKYRYQVEEDIKPFRDVLLGLFFITVGMLLDVSAILRNLPYVMAVLVLLLAAKFAIAGGLSRAFGASDSAAMRTGLWLAAGGEFGFVLLAQAKGLALVREDALQTVIAALVLSLLLAPLIVHYSDRLVLRFAPSEWLLRSMELTRIAAQSMATERHAIICGYGRSGQYLARFLVQERISYVALDLDPERVREAAAAGDTVVYGDAVRRETLVAAGLMRASIVIVSFSDLEACLRVMACVQALRPELPVVVRARDEKDMDRLTRAGAAGVVAETFEASLMLGSHALILIGVPINRVVRRIRELRESRYELLRGFFHGASDESEHLAEAQQPRLHSVALGAGAAAIGRTIGELGLDRIGVTVSAVRRREVRSSAPAADLRLDLGDVVVLLGTAEGVARAEDRLLRRNA